MDDKVAAAVARAFRPAQSFVWSITRSVNDDECEDGSWREQVAGDKSELEDALGFEIDDAAFAKFYAFVNSAARVKTNFGGIVPEASHGDVQNALRRLGNALQAEREGEIAHDGRSWTEPSDAVGALVVSLIGRPLSPTEIDRLKAAAHACPDALSDLLAELFRGRAGAGGSICAGYAEWIAMFKARTERGDGPVPSRASITALHLFESVRRRHEEGGDGVALAVRLRMSENFLSRLDRALGLRLSDKGNGYAWRHRSRDELEPMSCADLDRLVYDRELVAASATEYLADRWLSDPHLDWVFADAFVAAAVTDRLIAVQRRRLGVGWLLFGGNPWKLLAWRIVGMPLGYAFAWLMPPWFLWKAATDWHWSKWSVGLMAVCWFVPSVLGLVRTVGGGLLRLVAGRAPKDEAEMESLFAAYATLGGDVVHVGAVREALSKTPPGLIDQHIHYILDAVAERGGVWHPR